MENSRKQLNKFNKNLLISVIISVYNTEKYLRQCLDSVINQSYAELEIIIVDDGSTDSSPEICEFYKNIDKRVTVIHQINKGRIAARESGFNASHGEYVSFIDSDDYLDSNMYEEAVKEISNADNPDCIVFGLKEIYGERKVLKKNGIPAGYYEKEVLSGLYSKILYNFSFFEYGIHPSLAVKLIKKEVIEKSGYIGIDNKIWYGEDLVGTMYIFSKIKSLLILDYFPYNYRQNNYTNGLNTLNVSENDLKNLYWGLKKSAEKYPEPYLIKEQIKMYMFFMTLLRQYDKTAEEHSDYLFPFNSVKKGSDVVLYGAGQFGIAVYKYLKKTNFCNVIIWVDINAEQSDKAMLPVELPEKIYNKNFDYILITILNERTADAICESITGMGIDKRKILYINSNMIKSQNLPEWLDK